MKKRVLITGSAGFVASHLVDYLLEKTDWEIIGLDSFKHRGDSLRVQKDPRYSIHCCDLSAPISYRLQEQIGMVDYILNLASESHVDRSISDPVPFIQNNVNIALNMLEFARRGWHEGTILSKFLQFGTDESYGAASEGGSHKEWSPILPSNPYAASKAAQEAIAISYWRTYGVPVILTNTMNVFSSKQDPEKYIPMLIQKIMKGQTVTVHGTAKFIGKRTYIHASSVADAVLFILNKVEPEKYVDGANVDRPCRFNIVGEKEVDNLELAQMVAQILDKPLHYELIDFHLTRSGHDRVYRLDGSKMAKIGWVPPRTFDKSLRETVLWTLDNPIWSI